jgi:adenylate kinase
MSSDDGTTGGAGQARPKTGELPSDPAEIEQLIAARRSDLASTIDELVVRAHPKEIARRSAADAKGRLRAFATTEGGQLRTERLAAVAGAVLAVVSLLVLLRRRRSRAR